MKKVLLLNPPGKKRYLRDYYCSKVSQAGYLNPPLDLLLLSGRIYEKYQLEVVDAIVERLTLEQIIKNVRGQEYAAIIILVGSVSWEEDKRAIAALKEAVPCPLIATGDVVREQGAERLREVPDLDALLLDFTTDDVMRYLDGERSTLHNMIYRDQGVVHEALLDRERWAEFSVPVPRHEFFIHKRYRHPFARRAPLSALLSDYGCPFQCTFCIMNTLGFKYRPVANVLAELRHLVSLGVKELFWADQTFGAEKERGKEICRQIILEKIDIGWFTFSRVDIVNYELLQLMKQAGCHTIVFGIESANEHILKLYKKGYTRKQIEDAFAWCDQLGIETAGTFIIGLPEETRETCLETIEFAKKIKCDYVSFNVAVPRLGTELREKAVSAGMVNDDFIVMDQSGTTVAMPTKSLSREEVRKLKSKAVREFYLRPSYLMRRIRKIRSFSQFKTQMSNGLNLMGNFLR